jgi:alanine racemase
VTETSRLTLDLDALASNHAVLKAAAKAAHGGAEIAPAVKADGYGLGAALVAGRLWDEGARSFYVARLSEGVALRQALGDRAATIYLLDGVTPGSAPTIEAAALTPVLNSLPQVEAWNSHARGRTLDAVLHIDTGMNRLGLRPEEAGILTSALDRLKSVNITLVISHLACAGEPDHELNARQLARFTEAAALFPNARRSLANSGGIFLGDDYHFDQCRPGISLYGGGPRDVPDARIKAVATLETPILQARVVPRGESIGYGAAFVTKDTTRVAILAAGYADGVPRAAYPRGAVWFDGALRPILGRVSMDLIAVDITDCDPARPGALMQIVGPERLVDDAAAAAGTTAYELLTRIAPRARRVVK